MRFDFSAMLNILLQVFGAKQASARTILFSIVVATGVTRDSVSSFLVGPSTFKVTLEDGTTKVSLFAGGSDPVPAAVALGLVCPIHVGP
jgi:hypothetical protein